MNQKYLLPFCSVRSDEEKESRKGGEHATELSLQGKRKTLFAISFARCLISSLSSASFVSFSLVRSFFFLKKKEKETHLQEK